ncbi:hypothetical protein GCM10011390_35340 [Aureimonas endophytica]|uniref:Uncharacterized protein n=1 Tax=Aureimonas endophytica TaxID=2027858 RepID=A0A917E809_9HYPH|nr:hypothetical protein [Aureimonas endophytica]GGE13173.1 hypothetical protein GCM10011390_35340 [Aureimonas endophytica]
MSASHLALATSDIREVPAFRPCPTALQLAQRHEPSAAERLDLDRLRWMALRSQLAPRPDLERACFLLAGETGVSFERFAIAFFRGLQARARLPMTLYRPGARHMSDDEVWLLRLVAAWRRGEDKGAAALVAWRVEASGRRWMRFLSAGMVRAMDEL